MRLNAFILLSIIAPSVHINCCVMASEVVSKIAIEVALPRNIIPLLNFEFTAQLEIDSVGTATNSYDRVRVECFDLGTGLGRRPVVQFLFLAEKPLTARDAKSMFNATTQASVKLFRRDMATLESPFYAERSLRFVHLKFNAPKYADVLFAIDGDGRIRTPKHFHKQISLPVLKTDTMADLKTKPRTIDQRLTPLKSFAYPLKLWSSYFAPCFPNFMQKNTLFL